MPDDLYGDGEVDGHGSYLGDGQRSHSHVGHLLLHVPHHSVPGHVVVLQGAEERVPRSVPVEEKKILSLLQEYCIRKKTLISQH